ncbi:MAG: hypothetical protein KDB14_05395 [Planctomycetales bacterium]|nr:hypothetical protein [Planctomycetales bacterium]
MKTATASRVGFKLGYRARITAEAAHGELEKIRANHGGELLPEHVVEAASRKRSPLHEVFDWDDKEAAHQWRLEQARSLIRAVVVYETESETEKPTRAFLSVRVESPTATRNVYKTTADALSNESDRLHVLRVAKGELAAFRAKYRQLTELAKVFEAIDEALS